MINEKFDSLLSYCAGFIGLVSQVDWMSAGAVVLLIARLVVDVPKACFYIKGLIHGDASKRTE